MKYRHFYNIVHVPIDGKILKSVCILYMYMYIYKLLYMYIRCISKSVCILYMYMYIYKPKSLYNIQTFVYVYFIYKPSILLIHYSSLGIHQLWSHMFSLENILYLFGFCLVPVVRNPRTAGGACRTLPSRWNGLWRSQAVVV